MSECKRVIKSSGSIWVNLGDTYNTESGNMKSKDYKNTKNVWMDNGVIKEGYTKSKILPNKSLMLIPHRFAIRCIDELGLILRNDIIWAKPNGMPESVTDRFSKKHEFFFLFVKSQKYYFDLEGVREKHKHSSILRLNQNINSQIGSDRGNGGAKTNGNMKAVGKIHTKNYGQKMIGGQVRDNHDIHDSYNPSGKNPGDVADFWSITTKGSSEKHYATFNSELIDKPIIAGCPEYVCKKCGKAREKIVTENVILGKEQFYKTGNHIKVSKTSILKNPNKKTDCNCNAGFTGGIILDPFAGTGTTLIRALELGRNVIGIEGKKEYYEIAKKRIDKELLKINMFA